MDHSLLSYGVVILVAVLTIIGRPCGGRDLRPSDHGLAFQDDLSSPPPDTLSFFGGSFPVELPEAKNISDDTTWWRGARSRDPERDHVRVGLLVASGICGLTGVALMVVSGVVFVFRAQKQRMINAKADGIGPTSSPIPGPALCHAVNGKK